MRDQARDLVSHVPGVSDVQIEMTAAVRTSAVGEGNRQPVAGVKNVIAVGAGKGGVGKTTVAVNLAVALAQMGSRVAMIDGDIYGPNVPMMLGLDTQLVADEQGRIIPAEAFGIQVVSMGFMTNDDSAVIWRGPMLHGAIQQFFRQVAWTDVDYLVVDLPPGTGDVALSLSQSVPVSGAIVVTTPQKVSLSDTRRAVRMYQKLNIRTLGLIENMSSFECPSCGVETDLFGRGAGEALATEMSVPFLGRLADLPADPHRRRHGAAHRRRGTTLRGRARLPRRGGAGGRAGVDCQLQPRDPAHPCAMRHARHSRRLGHEDPNGDNVMKLMVRGRLLVCSQSPLAVALVRAIRC